MGKQSALQSVDARDKTRSFYLSVASLIVTSAVSVFTVYYSASAKQTAQSAYASRVELMQFTTNDNGHFPVDDRVVCDTCWKQSEFDFSATSGSLGIARQVTFATAFDEIPQVACSLSAINLANLHNVITVLGYVPSKDSTNHDGLDFTSIRVDAENPRKDRFDLRVSIPLRQSVIAFLQKKLVMKELIDDREAVMHKFRNQEIQHPYEGLTADEVWMINFQNLIGTFDVSCIAQANSTSRTPKIDTTAR